jgi:rod shape determining protein RodA
MFERRLYYHIDWALLAAVLAICATGVVMIYATSSGSRGSQLYVTQLSAIGLGLGAMLVTLSIDYRSFTDKSHLIYTALLAALLYVVFFGDVQMGARRWIRVGSLNIQPSEFAKVGVALVLAKVFSGSRSTPSWHDLVIAGALTCLPIALIAQQPDLGTAATLLPVFLAVAYLAGMHLRYLGFIVLGLILTAPISWKFVLKDYQRTRISSFLDPSQDARGAGYQQLQARITVGSGGLTGKGFRQGTQGQLRFLPVAHNDFIFSVLAEERGFAGVVVALGLYLFVIVRALQAARLSKDRLGSYLVLGVLASFTFQVIYNITMSAGLAPVKGLTLPLMSYGGSSMVATLAGFGLVLNVRMRRFTN